LWLKLYFLKINAIFQLFNDLFSEQGRLFVFGSNDSGQLGLQAKGPIKKPICVKG